MLFVSSFREQNERIAASLEDTCMFDVKKNVLTSTNWYAEFPGDFKADDRHVNKIFLRGRTDAQNFPEILKRATAK